MRNARRPALFAVVPVPLLAATLALFAATPPAPRRRPAMPVRPPNAATTETGWKEIDRLVDEQKLEEASSAVATRLQAAKRVGDEEEWTRCLIKAVQLRSALHGYETAVRFLRDEPGPQSLVHRTALELFYAHTLVTYLRNYSWEIRKRERVDSQGEVDLKAWTVDQIAEEALRAYEKIWNQRETLGDWPLGKLAEYLAPGTYPAEVRGTLRDAASYLLVELLADSSLWRPEQSNEVFRLKLATLLANETATPGLVDPAAHPLQKITGVLGDLETWHAKRGDREASLEARLERVRRLHASFTENEDRTLLIAHLKQVLPAYRGVPWWAVGVALLAEQVRAGDAPDAMVEARRIALEGQQAYPQAIGGRQCLTIVKSIEAPDFQIASMTLDAARKRSIEVTHRNLASLSFRAWRRDVLRTIESSKDYDLLGTYRDTDAVLKGKPDAEWTVELPETPDYRSHRTFVTPPVDRPGLYTIAASARPDFGPRHNRVVTASLIVSELVLVTRQLPNGVEVTATLGATGAPVSGAEIMLYRADWNTGHRRAVTRTSDADGTAAFDASDTSHPYFVIARHGEQVALDPNYVWLQTMPPERERTAALIYTDRSVYRPMQSVNWKVVAYQGGGASSRFGTLPSSEITVSLVDPNQQVVESRTVRTNTFGSTAGAFTVPTGRVLGQWWIRTSTNDAAAVRVEEYKRPTFEVTLDDPEAALRLNRRARLAGVARYYFGLPVTNGAVRWQVTREPVWPWWWGYWHRHGDWGVSRVQTVATGTSQLDADGRFRLEFTPEADERKPKEVSYRYSVSADVTDEGGETRSAARAFRLGFVSIEASVDLEAAFLREGEEQEVVVRRADLDGTPRAGEGTWRLVALTPPATALPPADQPLPVPDSAAKAYQTAGDTMRPRWARDYSPDAVLAGWSDATERQRGRLQHAVDGKATLRLRALHPGAYRLRYETRDAFGAVFAMSKDLVVAGRDRTPLPVPAILLTERRTVHVGDTARLLVLSGYPEGRLVVDVEKAGRRMARHLLTAGRDRTLLEIPITPAERGGFGVTLTVVRDHQVVILTQQVFVPWDDRQLKLEFATFRDRLRPGGHESWRVTVRSADGTPPDAGAAELLAYMYDRSLDVFAPHHPPGALGVYPTRTGTSWVRASLGENNGRYVLENDFANVPPPPALAATRLQFFDDYGIGGMGRRYLQKAMAAGLRPAAPATRDRAAQAMEFSAQVALEADVEGGVPGGVVGGVVGGLSARADEPAAPSPPPAPVEMRSQFAETAFWQPHLLTADDGSATIEFTVPDSVTSWNVWVHALTRDMRGGTLKRETRSVKDLMVRPYLPRFLREGDRAAVKVVVNNASQSPLTGTLSFDIIDPDTERSLLAEFGLTGESNRPFTAGPGAGADLTFPIVAPPRVGQLAFRVAARAGDLSDGELRPLPILPGRMHLAQSRFVTLRPGKPRTMTFADLARGDDPSLVNERMVVSVDAQLFYGVLQALPYLVDYPYECTEQTLNRFLSTAILSSLFRQYPAVAKMAEQLSARETRLETWAEADPNRKMALEETPWLQEARGGADPGAPLLKVLDPRIARAQRETSLAKLRKAQTSLGAFPWWPGGPPSPYMTLYIVHGFAKGLEFGVETPKDVTVKAWAYLHRHYLDEIVREMRQHDCCWEFVTLINYVLSAYPDPSWTGGVFTDAERAEMLAFSFRHWKQHSPYLKGLLALTLSRASRQGDARLVFDSVMDSAKTEEDLGTYWAPEDRAWLWYNDTIESHAFALRVLSELRPTDARRDGLVQWLFLNKKLNHWKSTRATAEVVYSLAHYLKGEGALGAREEVRVAAGAERAHFVFEPDRYTGKNNQLVIAGDQVDPRTTSRIEVEKDGPGLAFASATWHFSTEKLPEEDRGDLLSVSRRYFRRENRGTERVLAPLAEGATLTPGDEVEVQLSIRAKHAAEYVHLRDPRAAGLEPGVAVSRFKWDLGIGWYEEVRDSGTNFFFEQLPAGEYTFKYRLRANMAGTFKVSPATLQSMYAPEFTAYSAGAVIRVGDSSAGPARATLAPAPAADVRLPPVTAPDSGPSGSPSKVYD